MYERYKNIRSVCVRKVDVEGCDFSNTKCYGWLLKGVEIAKALINFIRNNMNSHPVPVLTISPQRILVVRRDNIGDLVCTTPLFSALRQAFPQAHIAALVNSYNAQVLRGNPDIDAVYVYTKLKHRDGAQSRWKTLWDRLRLIAFLRRNAFDLALLARSDFDRHGLNFVRWLGISRVVGYCNRNPTPRGLDVPLPIPDNDRLHEVEAVCRLLAVLGMSPPPGPLRLFPAADQLIISRELLDGKTGIAVHISAREAGRRLAAEKWVEVLKGLRRAWPEACLLLFWSPGMDDDPRHPGDDNKAHHVLKAAASEGVAVIPFPTTSLDQLVAGLAVCDLFVGADGGAMHVAAGVGRPVVALFENNAYKCRHWYPWQVDHEMVVSPQRDIGDISSEAIVQASIKLMNRTKSSKFF